MSTSRIGNPQSSSHGGASRTTSNRSSQSKYVRDCICGRGLACTGMTQAFRLLGDPRCKYVELPRYRADAPVYKYVFRNNLRAAYLRHLKKLNPRLDTSTFDVSKQETSSKHRYVALHHFHPSVVRAFYENPLTAAQKHKVPISITHHELTQFGVEAAEEDRILNSKGLPTGGYYFCPSYPPESAHGDLRLLIKSQRKTEATTTTTTKRRDDHPTTIEITSKTTPKTPVSKVPENITLENNNVSESRQAAESKPRLDESTQNEKETQEQSVMDETQRVLPDPSDEGPPLEVAPVEARQAESKEVVVAPNEVPHVETEPAIQPSVEEQDTQECDKSDEPVASVAPVEIVPDDANDVVRDIAEPVVAPATSQEEAQNGIFESNDEEDHFESGDAVTDFDALWGEDDKDISDLVAPETSGFGDSENDDDRGLPSTDFFGTSAGGLLSDVIHEDENEDATERSELANLDALVEEDKEEMKSSTSAVPNRLSKNRAWDTPNYRRKTDIREDHKRVSAGPMQFIDPSTAKSSNDVAAPPIPMDTHTTTRSNDDEEIVSDDEISLGSAGGRKKKYFFTDTDEYPPIVEDKPVTDTKDPPGRSLVEKNQLQESVAQTRSFDSEDSVGISTQAVMLNHKLPGSDPTLRIQVHNDLIAWESMRRSDMTRQLEFLREQWKATRGILLAGVGEVDFSERLVSGFAKAGNVFADSLQAAYDDKLHDDAGNAVTNSFFQNRLQKQRVTQEYSIESGVEADAVGGQSALLKSILAVQLQLAETLRASSEHMESEILPEIAEFRAEFKVKARELESLGDSIVAEMQRSEIEVKNIWDVFDAMVTGDLMEYSVHGSMHGTSMHGSQHGGSFHSSLGGGSSSIHGFLTPREDGGAPIVSTVNSPLLKSTFRQLGGVEDGWLIETYYKSAVVYQQSVFRLGEKQLLDLAEQVIELEEYRFRRVHQVMLAFVPRQRRLFVALPDPLKIALSDLVGLRIDPDSLQEQIDTAIRDRSHNHLKRGASHRSGIMNRSRLKAMGDSNEEKVESIAQSFGNPFDSSMVVLSKVAELLPGGLRGIVNATWKPCLIVVTSEGHFHVFLLPGDIDASRDTREAFESLCPRSSFERPDVWVAGRKNDIAKALTPMLTLTLQKCSITNPKMRNRQLDIMEERPRNAGSRFLNAVKDRAQQGRKCTIRLASPVESTEWMSTLEKTKKDLFKGRGNRFRF